MEKELASAPALVVIEGKNRFRRITDAELLDHYQITGAKAARLEILRRMYEGRKDK